METQNKIVTQVLTKRMYDKKGNGKLRYEDVWGSVGYSSTSSYPGAEQSVSHPGCFNLFKEPKIHI